MKRSETISKNLVWLAVFVPVALVVPNVLLDITEPYISVIAKVANVFLPFFFYLFLTTIFKRTGWGVLCTFPFMLFAAFQLVLLYLYGESIIAVDMFLNVATTDVEEAGTLLGNLTPAIILVIILFLPPLVWMGIAIAKKRVMPEGFRRPLLGASIVGTVGFGVLTLVISLNGRCVPDRDIFPVNVSENLISAFRRGARTQEYPYSARDFNYQATDADSTRRIVALVIGETSRPDRWQIFGAERPTNPLLSRRDGIVTFPYAVTQSNTTHKSVPLLLTPLTAETFDSINSYKSIITAFKEAGFQTMWLSNQPPNRGYNEHMGYEADTTLVFKYVPDVDLIGYAAELLKQSDPTKSQLIVLHTYGAHFPYADRYKGQRPTFTPDGPMIANKANRQGLLNAYDNATVATDMAIDSLISLVSAYSPDAAVVYAADHGEDIFDDDRGRFLHASPAPTAYQLRVPMLIWLSPAFERRKGFESYLEKTRLTPIQPSSVLFHTAIDLGGLRTPYYDSTLSVVSPSFSPMPLMYLTDRNEAVPLLESGLRQADVDVLTRGGVIRNNKK